MKNIVLPVINLLPFIRDLKLSWHRTVVGHNTTETYVNRGSGPVPQAACAEKKKNGLVLSNTFLLCAIQEKYFGLYYQPI